MQDVLGYGAQEDADHLAMATRAYHECTGSLTESSECRPRGLEHSLALDDDRGLKVLGQAGCVRNDGLGRFMDEALWNDEAGAPCRGHHLLRTHDVERYVPSGRLSDSELDGAGGAGRSVDAHDDSRVVYAFGSRLIRSHCNLLGVSVTSPLSFSHAARSPREEGPNDRGRQSRMWRGGSSPLRF